MNVSQMNTENAQFLTVEQAKERYQLCRNTIVEIAKEADAFFKIKHSVRIDAAKMDSYFRQKYKR